MSRDSRADWASFDASQIPTKHDVTELELFLARAGAGGRLLDLGCGNGALGGALASRGYEVTGVDINRDAVAAARACSDRATFLARDIASPQGLDLEAAPFRIVICQLVVSIVGSVSDRQALLRNAFDVLEPGGWFYISASEVSDDVNPGYQELYARDFPVTGERTTYLSRDNEGNVLYATHHFTSVELQSLLEVAGFETHRTSSKTETSSRRPDEAAHFLYVIARKPATPSEALR